MNMAPKLNPDAAPDLEELDGAGQSQRSGPLGAISIVHGKPNRKQQKT